MSYLVLFVETTLGTRPIDKKGPSLHVKIVNKSGTNARPPPSEDGGFNCSKQLQLTEFHCPLSVRVAKNS